MEKVSYKGSFLLIITALLIALVLSFTLGISKQAESAFAEGAEPSDSRARIGFASENGSFTKYYLEDDGGRVTVRVYVSKVQSVDVAFTLTEARFNAEGNLFVMADSYTLIAGSSYIDVTFNQIAQAEEGSGVRLSEIYIQCDTPTVTVGDIEYYGEVEPYDDDFLAVVYDKDDRELIVEGFPFSSYETDGIITSRMLRSGALTSTADVYYHVKNYDENTNKELIFDNYNSLLTFEEGEKEKILELKFFDNDWINLREGYEFEITATEGVERIFDVTQRRYIEDGEKLLQNFAIADDDPLSEKYIARVQYYQSGETDPKFEITEGGELTQHIFIDGLRENIVPSFRIYYSIGVESTAEYGVDYLINGNYKEATNIGYIEVPVTNSQFYEANLIIDTVDDIAYKGTRTVFVKFYIIGRSDILMQALDTVRIEITDNEFLPSDNTISWIQEGSLNGCGDYDNGVLTINKHFQYNDQFIIGVDTDYQGTSALNILVKFEDVTAKNGVDYLQESDYGLLIFYAEHRNKYGIDINIINDLYFSGTRRLKVTLINEGLTRGLSIAGNTELYIDLEGKLESNYNYIEYTEQQIDDIFSIGKKEALTFTLKRLETGAYSTYLDLEGNFVEGTHIQEGLFPYEVVWAENEIKKDITLEFLQGWSDSSATSPSASGLLICLNSDRQPFNNTYGQNQNISVGITLYESNSDACYYFAGSEYLSVVRYEYLYSSDSVLRIPVTRELISAQYADSSVNYNLTFDYRKNDYLILSADAAEIGTHINNISGTLNFYGDETIKYITVTVPDTVNLAFGSKFVNIDLCEPSEKTYLLYNFDYAGKFSMAQIKITNDVTPILDYSEVTTTTVEDGLFETTNINPFEYQGKQSDIFNVELIPYPTDETPYLTKLFYSFDIFLYSGYDLSTVGVEVFVNGIKIQCSSVDAYVYNYTDGSGSHLVTYNHAYIASVLVNKENPFISFTIKYSEIEQAGLSFLSTSLLLKANCPYFMDGWQTYEKQLLLNACDEGASEAVALSVPLIVSEGEANLKVGDTVLITVTRSSFDAGASAMFYESEPYVVKSFATVFGAFYYYEPLNSLITFAPYERSKTVPFVTRDNRPQGTEWDIAAAAALIKIYNYHDETEIFDELTINVCEELSEIIINAELSLLTDCIMIQKGYGEDPDEVAVKFVFDKAYAMDIEFTLSGLHQRIGNLSVTLPAGETELEHNFTFNEENFAVNYERIAIGMTATLVTAIQGVTFNLAVPEGLSVLVSSASITNRKFHAGVPSDDAVYENDSQGITLDIIADRVEDMPQWKDITAYVTVGGTAVYGTDYYITYNSKSTDQAYDISTGVVIISRLNDRATLQIKPIDNSINEGTKTIEVTIMNYYEGYVAYPQTFTFNILEDEYFGDVYLRKTEHLHLGYTMIIPYRENNSMADLTINYETEQYKGVYGVDYIFICGSDYLPKNGSLTFTGNTNEFLIQTVIYTQLGRDAAFYFRISTDGDNLCSIKDSSVFVSLRRLNLSGDFTVRTISNNTILNKRIGNYTEYLLDYTKYYRYYSTENTIKITSANFAGTKEDIYLQYYADGRTEIKASGRVGNYAVPSGISLNNWCDINGDGIKELIFVANLDSCFGGASELAALNMLGVYALDLVSGQYTPILELNEDEASKHLDVYSINLKGDDCPEFVVFSTPWADTLLRKEGGNILYIIGNTDGTLTVENIYDSNALINGNNMNLYSVSVYNQIVNDRNKEYDRNYLQISYYSSTGTDNSYYGALVELSAEDNARIIYFEGEGEKVEGSKFEIKIYNVSGIAGEATVNFTGDNAVFGRDYAPQSAIVIFAQGEYEKTVTLLTLNNNIPTDTLKIFYSITSEDFAVANRIDGYFQVNDASVVNKGIAYTILEEFDASYTGSQYVTGDKALFSINELTIDGIKCGSSSNELYDVRFSVECNYNIFTDDDNDGIISVIGLESIFTPSFSLYNITVIAEFLEEGSSIVLSKKYFSVDYRYYYNVENKDKVINEVNIPHAIFMGKLTISAQSLISIWDNVTNGSFSLSFISNLNNKTYVFYSDNKGKINAQINFDSVEGLYEYSYTITYLSVNAPMYSSGQLSLASYKETMDFPITAIDSVRQTLLKRVLIEVVGINIDYSYIGYPNSETGVFMLPDIFPLKTYRITVNGDYGISYFEKYCATFGVTLEEPNLSISLEVRTAGISLDMLAVTINRKRDIRPSLEWIARSSSYVGDYGKIERYLYGEAVVLNSDEQLILQEYMKRSYYGGFGGSRGFLIRGDVLFSTDYPSVYRSLSKEADDLTIVSYRYNPDLDFADIKLLIGREELSDDNYRHLCYNLTYDRFGIGENDPNFFQFYVFSGGEDCIIDLQIESEAYLEGSKVIPLASFGTGLGSFLIEPVQNVFSSIETATVPANLAFLNGMSFMLGFANIDFAFDYDEENMTFSIYMGASKDLYEKSHGMDYGNIGRPTLAQLRAAKAAGLGMGRGQAGLGVGLGGKMIFKYVNGDWDLLAGEIYFSVNASYNYTKYILLPVISIPAFFSATVSLEIETTIYFNWNEAEEYTEITGDLAIELSLEIECGIGIRGFLSASVYGRAGIEVIIQLESGASKLTLYVEGGVRIQIIFWKFNYSFGRAEWSTQSSGYVDRAAAFQSLQLSQLNKSSDYTGVAALYSASGDLMMGAALGAEGQAEEIMLVSNIYEKGSPKIAEIDNTKMIAWINYDATRGKNNAEVINYIYFDGESWSEVFVADETLTADLDMDIKAINGKFAIILTEVKEEQGDDSTISNQLIKSDVAVLVFDSTTKTFSKTILTNNLFNDRQALFDYANNLGIAIVYRSENTNITDDMTVNDFLCGENADNKLYYSIYNSINDTWEEFSLFQYSLAAVSTMSVKIVEGIAYIALEVDNDDNFDTTTDREIVLIQYIFATRQSRITYITDNEVADVAPALMEFKGKAFLAYRSDNDVNYWYENQSYKVCTLPQTHTNFDMFTNGNYAVMLFTAPIEGVSQVFASVMDGESMVFSSPCQITFSQKPTRDPIVSFDGDEITVYYCSDTYTLISSSEEDYEFSITSVIVKTEFNLFSELAVEVLTPDFSTMRPGEEYDFTVRIYNLGNVNVNSPWVKIYEGETLIGELTAGVILGNGYLDVLLSAALPQMRSTLRVEIGKDGLEENLIDNVAEVEVLLSDVAVEEEYELTWNNDGTLKIKLSVTNKGAVDMSNITVKVTAYSDITISYASMVLAMITAGETKEVTLIMAKENVRFNINNELWLKGFALTEGKDIYSVSADDYNYNNNVRSLRASRPVFADGNTIALLNENLDLTVGGSSFIDLLYLGDGDITITSSDTSILSVDGRNLVAHKSGTVTLTITDGTNIRSVQITVANSGEEEPNTVEEPNEPEAPSETITPVIEEEENFAKWWIYGVSVAGGLLLSVGVIIILVKKKIIKIKK